MDAVQELEAELLSRQKPINDLIKRGNSPIQEFYKGKTLFVTGGSGFIGRQLIEKLLRSCEIKKVYTLMRPKMGISTKDRLLKLLKDEVFESVHKLKPDFADKIVPVEGDVGTLRLGLTDNDWDMLTKEVNIIIHAAATIRFDEPLRLATVINVLGTREMLQLARECLQLDVFTYVSTAYTHTTENRINQDVFEQFYPCPVTPEILIDLVTTVDDERINKITEGLIQGWPNTYTFTKALAEDLIRRADDLPICVVKPPFVTNSYLEPSPGWIDLKSCLSGPIGFVLAMALGVAHIFHIRADTEICFAPVDLVNNAIIAAGWDTLERKRESDKDQDNLYMVVTQGNKWQKVYDYFGNEDSTHYETPKAVWYAWIYATTNTFLYTILLWLVHYIPAYVIDSIMDVLKLRPKGIPPLLKVYSKIEKVAKVYKYFLFHDFYFKNNGLRSMHNRMSENDRIIFNCNLYNTDITEFLKSWIIGLRRYVIKDGLRESQYAHKKQQFLRIANAVVALLYGYLIWKVLYLVYSILRFIFL